MKTLKFECTLLSDIIINQRSATEGLQNTLDFIPGGNFLGIAASELYNKISPESALKLFHSGLVRFGDAHPLYMGRRSLRVPASMYYPKLGNKNAVCYIHHAIPQIENQSEEFRSLQLKQCRSEFYAFCDYVGTRTKIEKMFVLKSAYDSNTRRSKDEALYSYESVCKGTVYCFEVECTDEISSDMAESIKKALSGIKRVGRSKSAQYGLVEIVWMDEDSYTESQSEPAKEYTTVYADGRLIFLDKCIGFPTYQPTVEQLGLTGGRILWEKSQIRTFQYAPWNMKRQTYDADRCGIEKGSVFVVENAISPAYSQYVGVYKNEGFGKVIYNPDFLEADTKTGIALYRLCELTEKPNLMEKTALSGDAFLRYLDWKKRMSAIQTDAYKIVNSFMDKNSRLFAGVSSSEFASQWGSIRNIAMQYHVKRILAAEIDKYTGHGVAKDKWAEKKRKQILDSFIKDKLSEDNAQLVLINLAAEMAKKCSKNGKG